MKLGFIGLGKMGSNMVLKLLEHGHEVVVWNRSQEAIENLKKINVILSDSALAGESKNPLKIEQEILRYAQDDNKMIVASSIEDLVLRLPSPKIIWSMLPSGEATESMLKEISSYAGQEDIVIDGSNSNFKDTQRRYDELEKKNIRFLGIGVAGGIVGPRTGYCLMAGGDKSAYDEIKPILDSLVQPLADHGYFGIGGAGHFVKMVHNGIEYGIMQSLAEGFDVLEHSPFNFDLQSIGKVWQKSSLVSGFMLDRAVEALEEDPHMTQIEGNIDATGEAEWTINQAKEEGVDVPSIELALNYRKESRINGKIKASFTAKMIAALRNKFGGHKVEKKN